MPANRLGSHTVNWTSKPKVVGSIPTMVRLANQLITFIFSSSLVCMTGNMIACDGKYLYVLHGSCMVKLGSGKHNTLR